jgi:hypothetical protein
MRLHETLTSLRHETRIQELSRERQSEAKHAERLAALLSKKTILSPANPPDNKAA